LALKADPSETTEVLLASGIGLLIDDRAAEAENRAYRDSLGRVYYRLGHFPEAVVELEKAVR
jgi:hypothetical protein